MEINVYLHCYIKLACIPNNFKDRFTLINLEQQDYEK
ncbi:hypothetical protein T4A_7935 [Trichinella pseudospiralis]|uniref:Uncharacterized protein n=1 Tax=Trichinella pseudospiralis TaxID=6337 RepID=A0A0V1GFR2_TRIPS|nr:hypothetical protein T4A_7935 [Trichinella pseudospiralis]KRY97086.1 hypothetical protein T4C_9104 [Trichinella pseudospiralis]